jgi:ATP-binding cassette subfamily B protein
VLADGKIVESGSPVDLSKGTGMYARFCEEQRLLSEVEGLELLGTERVGGGGDSHEDMSRPHEVRPEETDQSEIALRGFHEEGVLGKAFDGRLLRRIFEYLSSEQFWLWVAFGSVLATAVLALTRPLIAGSALDEAATSHKVGRLIGAGMLVSFLMVGEQIFSFVQGYFTQLAGSRAMMRLRSKLFRRLHELPIAFFDKQPIGRLTTRVTNDIDAISELFSSGILASMGDLLRLLGVVVIMLSVDLTLGGAAFASLPVVVGLVMILRRPMREAFRAIRTRTARMTSAFNEQITGMAVVQAFDQMERSEREFDVVNLAHRDAYLLSIRYESMQDAALETIASVSLAAMVLVYGASTSSFGTLLAFQLYLAQFFEPLSQLAQRYTLLQSAMAGAERVFGLLDEPGRDAPIVAHSDSVGPTAAPVPLINFTNVDFGYRPDMLVLRSLSFSVEAGEHIALVGPTGSGKSTVLALLLRLYEIERGDILLEGEDLRSISPKALRSRFAYVPQDPTLFPGNLLENIAGANEPNLDRARDVLEQIGVLEHFERRLSGLLSPVIGSGQALSAGERQLVAFARALYRDAPVLLLDEATASIDSDTEKRLQKALEVSLEKRTAIVIAHRLGTIRTADRILVLSHGRLVEQGTHRALVAQDGLYRRLVRLSSVREGVIID